MRTSRQTMKMPGGCVVAPQIPSSAATDLTTGIAVVQTADRTCDRTGVAGTGTACAMEGLGIFVAARVRTSVFHTDPRIRIPYSASSANAPVTDHTRTTPFCRGSDPVVVAAADRGDDDTRSRNTAR